MNFIKTILASSLVAAAPSFALALPAAHVASPIVSQKNTPATIKILIADQRDKVHVETRGRYQIYNPCDGTRLTSGTSSKRGFVSPNSMGMEWVENFPGTAQLRIVPIDPKSVVIVDGIEYRGCIDIYDIDGQLEVINEVDLENYLKSSLAIQFPDDLGEDVMDSIAVVARTNTFYLLNRNLNADWHFKAEEIDYPGFTTLQNNPHIDRAIRNTKNLIMTFNNQPFAACWTADSAGKTADFTAIFRKAITTPHGVKAPFAARDREKHAWSFAISKQDLSRALKANSISGMDIYQDRDSEKVYAVRIHDSTGFQDIDFFTLQKALGSHRLCSSDFTVINGTDQITFNGYGEGSGVGLCLYSAGIMAEHGDKTPKILATFFPETKLQAIRDLSSHSNEMISKNEKFTLPKNLR